ncbi:MAG: hypothetical protein AMS15_08115 [Planctomycetes bacterium DG_23]|nr:MAG: hypothetical protein AMS15_08115 [Planctomycetes bacterium DG_23]
MRLVEANRRRVRRLIRHAKKAGLKTIYHTYELAMPYGFEKAYPELYSPPIKEYRSDRTPEQRQRELCVARPEVREALSQKVAEICRAFPDLDGFMYTNNESATLTQVWHRCEHCRHIPFSRMMKLLHDAMKEGLRRSGRPVRLFVRCWGTHEHELQYHGQYKKRVDFGVHEIEEKKWLPDRVRAFKPARLHFKPSRDIPPFIRSVKGEDTAFVYKATWADVNLHHPLNPWIGKYKGHDQVCELSFERCIGWPRTFLVMGKEMQRRAKLCARRGVNGLCLVPTNWGRQGLTPITARPSTWPLHEVNFYLFAALAKDPNADLQAVTEKYLRRRFGKKLPAELARLLLDAEDIAADAYNVRGIHAGGQSLDGFYYTLLRYGPMFPRWETRVRPTPANLKRIFKEKDQNIARAQKALEKIERFKNKIPAKAYNEFKECFSRLLDMARTSAAGQKYCLYLWAFKDGYLKPTMGELDRFQKIVESLRRDRRRS